jgi:alkanesulfonate monooxygenase SsuD/methylene tetrahydromethanopterin reductase-like flavin-dependent oxidoreductase (luciferase family)
MCGIGVFAADNDAEARRLFTSAQLQFLSMQRGRPGQLQPPVPSMDGLWSEHERAAVSHTMRLAIVGGPDTVRQGLERFAAQTGADELLVTGQMFDHAARLRSYEIVADVTSGVALGR